MAALTFYLFLGIQVFPHEGYRVFVIFLECSFIVVDYLHFVSCYFQLPGADFLVFFGDGSDSFGGLAAAVNASSRFLLYVPTNSGRS